MMNLSHEQLWKRFQTACIEFPSLGLAVDLSRAALPEDAFTRMEPALQKAFQSMSALEQGAVANPDEKRRVGHYWLRNPALAPSPEIRRDIEDTLAAVKQFAQEVHQGRLAGKDGPFKNLLLIGIGGSALGPQFVSAALGHPLKDKMSVHFFDNTDPDGMDKVLDRLRPELGRTLCLVISKSGGTKETRNGMLEAQAAFQAAGVPFAPQAVAVTGKDSELDKQAVREGWLRRFPMWDWVGGRTSETSAVGLLPAALQGIDIDGLLAGAKACDAETRKYIVKENPSALIAMAWFLLTNGKGEKDMIVLPYKDRLELFSKYLQQLIMESIGKEKDLDGRVVNQGIAVYGNKGSTDQHAYVQQLRDGVNNFFVTFIEVLKDREGRSMEVEPGITSGDYLFGFLMGTRTALSEKQRDSISLTIHDISPFSVGVLIALFERAVGFYASLVNINAYHQPGVEAGKKAAENVIQIQKKVQAFLRQQTGQKWTAEQIAAGIAEANIEAVFKICLRLSAAPASGIGCGNEPALAERTFYCKAG